MITAPQTHTHVVCSIHNTGFTSFPITSLSSCCSCLTRTTTSALRTHRVPEPAATLYEHERDQRIRHQNEILANLGLPVRSASRGVDSAFDGHKVTKKTLAALDLTSALTQHEVEGCTSRADAGSDSNRDVHSDSSVDEEEMEMVTLGTRKQQVDHQRELFRETEVLLQLPTGRG